MVRFCKFESKSLNLPTPSHLKGQNEKKKIVKENKSGHGSPNCMCRAPFCFSLLQFLHCVRCMLHFFCAVYKPPSDPASYGCLAEFVHIKEGARLPSFNTPTTKALSSHPKDCREEKKEGRKPCLSLLAPASHPCPCKPSHCPRKLVSLPNQASVLAPVNQSKKQTLSLRCRNPAKTQQQQRNKEDFLS